MAHQGSQLLGQFKKSYNTNMVRLVTGDRHVPRGIIKGEMGGGL